MSDFIDILLVEDNDDDRTLFELAAKRCGLPIRLQAVMSGREAVDYLEARGTYGERARYPLPELIILDLLMPGMDGLAFLAWRKTKSWLEALPVVAFSGVDSEDWRARAAVAGATGFVAKPFDVADWPAAIRQACQLANIGRARTTLREKAA